MRTRSKLHIPGTDIKLGDLVKDELSNYVGIVTCHARHLTGCDTLGVTSRDKVQKDTLTPEERWFDVMRLVLVEENPMGVTGFPENAEPAGG